MEPIADPTWVTTPNQNKFWLPLPTSIRKIEATETFT